MITGYSFTTAAPRVASASSSYLFPLAVGILGPVVVVIITLAAVRFAVKIFRWVMCKIGMDDDMPLSSFGSNGVTDAEAASRYLAQGGDIRHASNQEFIRQWSLDEKLHIKH